MTSRELNLNIQESSIRKKRGISFFADKKHVDLTIEEDPNEIVHMMNYSILNRTDVGLEQGTSTQIQTAAQIMRGLPSPRSSALPKNKEKEIVSAMVRLNN